jgi:predicted negative regulator of RcsB-dependent stress response
METTETPVPESAPATVATVGAPEVSLGSELAMIKDLTGGNPVVTVILGALLVVGGPAGWKFWNNRQKLKKEAEEAKLDHELALKKLELETKVKLAEIEEDSEDKPKKKKKG